MALPRSSRRRVRRGVGDRPIPPRDARGRRRGGEGEATRAWVDWGAEREEREGREREREEEEREGGGELRS